MVSPEATPTPVDGPDDGTGRLVATGGGRAPVHVRLVECTRATERTKGRQHMGISEKDYDVATLADVRFAYPTYSAVIGMAARAVLATRSER